VLFRKQSHFNHKLNNYPYLDICFKLFCFVFISGGRPRGLEEALDDAADREQGLRQTSGVGRGKSKQRFRT
jgi:hypothetical protein